MSYLWHSCFDLWRNNYHSNISVVVHVTYTSLHEAYTYTSLFICLVELCNNNINNNNNNNNAYLIKHPNQ